MLPFDMPCDKIITEVKGKMSSSGTIFLSIASLAFISLLMIVYFTKERIATSENKIFTKLLVVSFVSLLSEIYITLMPIDLTIPLFVFSLKFYLIFVILWLSYFMEYVFIVTRNKKNKILIDYKKEYKKTYIIFWIINICVIIMSMVLPIYFYNSDTIKYSYGPSVNVTFGLAAIYTIIMFVYILKNIKNLKDKGYLPIIFFVIFLTVVAIVQKINPGLLLANTCFALITTLLYNTIENPDIKMLKELEYSKNLVEKSKNETISTLNYMQKELHSSLETINLLDEDKKNKNELKLIKFITEFGEKVSGLIELGKINSSDYKVQIGMYETYEMLEEIKELINNEHDISKKYIFDFSENINKVLYGDSEKIKQIILYTSKYIAKKVPHTKVILNVDKLSAGNLCRLKFSFIIQNTNKKYLLPKDYINDNYISNNYIKDMDYEMILTLLKMIDGKIEEKSNINDTEIIISINQKVMKEYDIKKQDIIDETKIVMPFNAQNKEILLVDNNEDDIKEIIKRITRYNTKIKICNSMEEVYDYIIENNEYSLILIDDFILNNNKNNSIKAIQRMNCSNAPIVVMVTKNKEEKEKEYLKHGLDNYIIKPIDDKQIDIIMKKYLQ